MSDLIERLNKESARGSKDDGSECCFAPKWTCCDPALLTEVVARIRELEAELAKATSALGQIIQDDHRNLVTATKVERAAIEAAMIERCAQAITDLMNESSDACWNGALSCADDAIRALKPSGDFK